MVATATETLSESNRERILAAASELCAEQGFEATSVEQVTERAGLRREDFTRIFAGLEECMAAAMSALMTRALAEVAASYEPDRSEADNGVRGVRAIFELLAAHPSSAHLACVGARLGPPAVYEAYETGLSVFAAMLECLWENSQVEIQPAGSGRVAIESAEAPLRREVAAGRSERLPALLPDFVYGITVAFLGQEEALRLVRLARELLAGSAWESAP